MVIWLVFGLARQRRSPSRTTLVLGLTSSSQLPTAPYWERLHSESSDGKAENNRFSLSATACLATASTHSFRTIDATCGFTRSVVSSKSQMPNCSDGGGDLRAR